MRVLLIDNFDSFSWNLVQALRTLGAGVDVVTNDAITAPQVLERAPDRLMLSPGPGRPEDAGVTLDAIGACMGRIPMLGVCLGHQAIAAWFGASIRQARELVHGRARAIHHDGRGVFSGMASPMLAARYHSLAVDETTLPPELHVTARADDGEVMAIRHRTFACEGIQFHPESFLTRDGDALLRNFLLRSFSRSLEPETCPR